MNLTAVMSWVWLPQFLGCVCSTCFGPHLLGHSVHTTFEKVATFGISNRGFNKLSNDAQLLKVEVSDTFENTTITKSVFPFIFFKGAYYDF